jgi:hypothetical protein
MRCSIKGIQLKRPYKPEEGVEWEIEATFHFVSDEAALQFNRLLLSLIADFNTPTTLSVVGKE